MGTLKAKVAGDWVPTATTGPAGPPGPEGPAGSGAVYVHTQSTAATTWTVNHNLGYKPSVEVIDAGGAEVIAQVLHVSVNQFQVFVNPAMSGLARAS